MEICRNCGRSCNIEDFFSKVQKYCSYTCSSEYDKRAQAVGGYHILARDETIRDLQTEVATLRRAAAMKLH